jgi:hypothetical protein
MEDIIAVTLIFGGGTLFLLSVSPVGRAIADRIRGRTVSSEPERLERLEDSQVAVMEELDHVRQELSDVQERLDFTERFLAQQRDVGRLPGSDSGPQQNVQG